MNNDETVEAVPLKVKKRRFGRILRGLLYLFLILIAGLCWLLGSESGLRMALFNIPNLFGTHLSAQHSSGTFWRGFTLKELRIDNAAADIQLSHVIFDWDSSQLFKGRLLIHNIDLGEINILSKKQESKKSKPPRLPNDTGLPLDLILERLNIDAILLGKEKQVVLQGVSASYRYQNKQHALHIQRLNSTWGKGWGEVRMDNKYPFDLTGKIDISGTLKEQAVAGELALSGSLKSPIINAHLDGQNVFLEVKALVSPFAPTVVEKIENINIQAGNMNPQAFWPTAPEAKLAFYGDIQPDESKKQLKGILTLSNSQAMPINQGGLPVRILYVESQIDTDGVLTLPYVNSDFFNQGQIKLNGQVDVAKQDLALDLQVQSLSLADLLSGQSTIPINGKMNVNGTFKAPEMTWELARRKLKTRGQLHIQTDKKTHNQTLHLDKMVAQDGKGGVLNLQGQMALYGKKELNFDLSANKFNPVFLSEDAPDGRINGAVKLSGYLQDVPYLLANIHITDSVLSSVPLSAKGELLFQDSYIARSDLNIHLGRNHVLAKGSLGRAKDKLNLDIDAPSLNQFGFGLAGAVRAKGFVAGTFRQPNIHLQGNVNQLAFRQIVQAQRLQFDVSASPDLNKPLNIDIKGNNLKLSGSLINHINLQTKGTLKKHHLALDAALDVQKKTFNSVVVADGGLNENHVWNGQINRLNLNGALDVLLTNPVSLRASAEALNIGSANWQILGGQLNLKSFQWQKTKGIHTQGDAKQIDLNHLKKLITLPIKQNVIFDADWNIAYTNDAKGSLNIRRTSGDITLPERTQTLGLEKLDLHTQLSSGQISSTLSTQTRFATGEVTLNIAQNFGDDIMKAPIKGLVSLKSDDLASLKYLLPIGLDIGGKLSSDIRIGGHLANPELNGPLVAENLLYHDKNTGVRLDNGTLNSHFNGKEWAIQSLLFQHDSGSLNIHGNVAYPNNIPDVNLQVALASYPVLNRPDQQVTLSGDTAIQYTIQSGLALTGKLKLDKALFDFPKSGMPSLSDDVVVVGRKKAEKSQAMPLNINLILDLNDAFRFSGKGLNVLMGGELNLQAQPKKEMRLLGSVNVVSGRYQAYGQDLEIEKGTIAFTGEVANPTLNIRAKRRNSQVGVGVDVTGTVNHPQANIFTNDPMSDKDKLSWLVLGRASSGDSDNAALAAAAGTMLAGGINDRIGLVDDIGLGSRQTRNAATGEMNPAEQMVTVGKHLTNRIYLGYEYGLSSTSQAVKLMYHLSKSFQLIGRVGSESGGGEVRYSKRFD